VIKRFSIDPILILTRHNERVLSNCDVIIPVGIDVSLQLNDLISQRIRNCLLFNSPSVYQLLDDKILFYDYVRSNDLLRGSTISLISTYDGKSGETADGKFIVKSKNGYSSDGNTIEHGKISDIVKRYDPSNYQIQDYLEIQEIRSLNFLALRGEIVTCLDFTIGHFVDKRYWWSDNKCLLNTVDPESLKVIAKIISKLCYSGIGEFEFLVDKRGRWHLMECNPRISSFISSSLSTDDRESPFINNIIKPYCHLVTGQKCELVDYKLPVDLIYKGKSDRIPAHYINEEGVLRFKQF
jgi:hypothetical protein